jgi:hypothetical protein
MAQPYNYSLNVPSPMQAFGKAFNVGAAGQKARYAREDREAGIARKEAEAVAVESFFAKPLAERTSEDYLRLGMINPQIAELAQSQFDALSAERQQVAFRDATQIHTALRNSLAGETDPEIVDQIFASRVEATRNDPGLNKMWVDARELAKLDPEGAEAMVGTRIATLPGGKDYFATMKTVGEEARAAALQPGKIKELADKVRFQEFEGFKGLAEAGVDIMAMVADDSEIRGPLQQIAKRQGQLNLAERAGNARAAEKLELEIANLKDAAQDKAQTKVNDVSNAMSGSEDLIGFIDKIIKAGGDPKDTGSALHETTGSYAGALPTLYQANVNFEAMINTLKSKIYLDKVALMRGTGPLSDREGAKLETAMRSLELRQSPQRFYDNLLEIQKLAVDNQALIKDKYGDMSKIQAVASGASRTPLMSGEEVFITVTTQTDFDQLQSGERYRGTNGKIHRKP